MASLGSSAMQASGPSMSLDKGGAGGGVGNYKGVMLCNRPFAGSVAQKETGGKSGKGTFICGLVADPAGMPVSLSKKDEKKVKRPKKETVLTKHRRWLSELQKTKDKLEMQYIDEMRQKEESKAAFQKQEKDMRLMSKEILHAPSKDDGAAEAKSPGDGSKAAADSKAAGAKGVDSKMLRRPAWALTESVAEVASEEKELDDTEGLLDFAAGLDFDKYIEDVEVQSMMAKLKERIAALERDIKVDDDREADAMERAALRAQLGALQDATDASSDAGSFDVDENLAALAKSVLDDADLGNVHSQASVESMLKQAKDKIAVVAKVAEATLRPDGGKQNMGVVEGGPNIVLHEPNEGQRVEGKNTVSNLPYMHRNPAV